MADGTIDGPRATHVTWDGGTQGALSQIQRAAGELIHEAPYGSLVLWGGRLIHGLRFAVISPAGGDGAGLDPAGPWLGSAEPHPSLGSDCLGSDDRIGPADHSGIAGSSGVTGTSGPAGISGAAGMTGSAGIGDVPGGHDAQAGREAPGLREVPEERLVGPASAEAAATDVVFADLAEAAFASASHAATEPDLFAQFDAAVPRDRLVLLAPLAVGRLLEAEDQACRFQICGPVTSNGSEWVSVALAGWVAPVPGGAVAELALEFTERHPTPDLLDLGSVWMLLELDLAEATVRTRSGCVRLETDETMDLLRRYDGAPDNNTPRQGTV